MNLTYTLLGNGDLFVKMHGLSHDSARLFRLTNHLKGGSRRSKVRPRLICSNGNGCDVDRGKNDIMEYYFPILPWLST